MPFRRMRNQGADQGLAFQPAQRPVCYTKLCPGKSGPKWEQKLPENLVPLEFVQGHGGSCGQRQERDLASCTTCPAFLSNP